MAITREMMECSHEYKIFGLCLTILLIEDGVYLILKAVIMPSQ